MDSRLALKAKKRRRRLLAQATFEATVNSAHTDPAKTQVMGYFRELVADDFGDWHASENGTIRLRLNTGEIYLLDKTTITRIA
jgi:putative component of toxin-antitoxin plasmid stabilization module